MFGHFVIVTVVSVCLELQISVLCVLLKGGCCLIFSLNGAPKSLVTAASTLIVQEQVPELPSLVNSLVHRLSDVAKLPQNYFSLFK